MSLTRSRTKHFTNPEEKNYSDKKAQTLFKQWFGDEDTKYIDEKEMTLWATKQVIPQKLLGVRLSVPSLNIAKAIVYMSLAEAIFSVWNIEYTDNLQFETVINIETESMPTPTAINVMGRGVAERAEKIQQSVQNYSSAVDVFMFHDMHEPSVFLNRLRRLVTGFYLRVIVTSLLTASDFSQMYVDRIVRQRAKSLKVAAFFEDEALSYAIIQKNPDGLSLLMSRIMLHMKLIGGDYDTILMSSETFLLQSRKPENNIYAVNGMGEGGKTQFAKIQVGTEVTTFMNKKIVAVYPITSNEGKLIEPFRQVSHAIGDYNILGRKDKFQNPHLFNIKSLWAYIWSRPDNSFVPVTFEDALDAAGLFLPDGKVKPCTMGIISNGTGYAGDNDHDILTKRIEHSDQYVGIDFFSEVKGSEGYSTFFSRVLLERISKSYPQGFAELEKCIVDGLEALEILSSVPYTDEWYREAKLVNFGFSRVQSAPTERLVRDRLDTTCLSAASVSNPCHEIPLGRPNLNDSRSLFGTGNIWYMQEIASKMSQNNPNPIAAKYLQFAQAIRATVDYIKTAFPDSVLVDERSTPFALASADSSYAFWVNALCNTTCFVYVNTNYDSESETGPNVFCMDPSEKDWRGLGNTAQQQQATNQQKELAKQLCEYWQGSKLDTERIVQDLENALAKVKNHKHVAPSFRRGQREREPTPEETSSLPPRDPDEQGDPVETNDPSQPPETRNYVSDDDEEEAKKQGGDQEMAPAKPNPKPKKPNTQPKPPVNAAKPNDDFGTDVNFDDLEDTLKNAPLRSSPPPTGNGVAMESRLVINREGKIDPLSYLKLVSQVRLALVIDTEKSNKWKQILDLVDKLWANKDSIVTSKKKYNVVSLSRYSHESHSSVLSSDIEEKQYIEAFVNSSMNMGAKQKQRLLELLGITNNSQAPWKNDQYDQEKAKEELESNAYQKYRQAYPAGYIAPTYRLVCQKMGMDDANVHAFQLTLLRMLSRIDYGSIATTQNKVSTLILDHVEKCLTEEKQIHPGFFEALSRRLSNDTKNKTLITNMFGKQSDEQVYDHVSSYDAAFEGSIQHEQECAKGAIEFYESLAAHKSILSTINNKTPTQEEEQDSNMEKSFSSANFVLTSWTFSHKSIMDLISLYKKRGLFVSRDMSKVPVMPSSFTDPGVMCTLEELEQYVTMFYNKRRIPGCLRLPRDQGRATLQDFYITNALVAENTSHTKNAAAPRSKRTARQVRKAFSMDYEDEPSEDGEGFDYGTTHSLGDLLKREQISEDVEREFEKCSSSTINPLWRAVARTMVLTPFNRANVKSLVHHGLPLPFEMAVSRPWKRCESHAILFAKGGGVTGKAVFGNVRYTIGANYQTQEKGANMHSTIGWIANDLRCLHNTRVSHVSTYKGGESAHFYQADMMLQDPSYLQPESNRFGPQSEDLSIIAFPMPLGSASNPKRYLDLLGRFKKLHGLGVAEYDETELLHPCAARVANTWGITHETKSPEATQLNGNFINTEILLGTAHYYHETTGKFFEPEMATRGSDHWGFKYTYDGCAASREGKENTFIHANWNVVPYQ